MNVDEAQAAIEADRQARAQAAAEEIQRLLETHRCTLIAIPQINAEGRVVAVVQIVPV